MIALLQLALALAAAPPVGAGPITTSPAAPPSIAAPAPPPPAAAPLSPPADPPRQIDDLSKPLLGAVPQGSYEAGLQGAFTRAENLQGPLDGAWVLSESGGAGLYRLQLDDPGFRGGPIEGAFRDLHAEGGGLGASGFLDSVTREGERVVLTFEVRGATATAALDPRPQGGYAGKLTRAGVSRDVVLARP